MSSSNWPMTSLFVASSAAIAGWWVGHPRGAFTAEAPEACEAPAPPLEAALVATPPPATWPLTVPKLADVPDTPLGASIRRGEQLVTHTKQALPDHVGSAYSCSNCHLKAGTVADAGPWIGVAGLFPMYRARTGTVVTLEDRVNDCFERSLNGKALPSDSEPMHDILAYLTWLSAGVPVGTPVEGRGFKKVEHPPEPDPTRGEALFASRCSACHGAEGQGLAGPDGSYTFPPLWGDASFNVAAGMARLDTASAFVRWNMPLGQGGTLTDQEAYDVAAFFITQPRPDFAGKSADWPNGGKPRDARY